MAHEFTEWEREREPQASSGHSVIPPRKLTGVGVLDPPVPPKEAPSLLRILAALILLGFAVSIVSMFLLHH